MTEPVAKALDPTVDGTPFWGSPSLTAALTFRDVGSSGLRQYGGYVREEINRALVGREAVRVYREMADNSAVVGAVLFAITQSLRSVKWRTEPANDSADAAEAAEFADSLRHDMSHPWEDHVTEALSMLTYGFAPCEIVYKRRLGPRGTLYRSSDASSAYDDGRIGIRRLPLRGQDTVVKWFFDENGQVRGLTQQPWFGSQIDLPIEKLLLYRPSAHKGNPEGKSILRTAYRAWWFLKRIEELEAITFERLSGLPVVRVPNALLVAAKAGDADATAALNAYKQMAVNVRIDEQMGIVLPSDVYKDANGSPSAQRMYDFELITPRTASLRVDSDRTIRRYNVDVLKTVLADFVDLGHQARGTQNLAGSKVDLFFQALEGWLDGLAQVQNRYLLPRVWELNALDPDLLPAYVPDLPQRADLDVLGKFVLALAQAGMRVFPDDRAEAFLRDAAGLPPPDPDRPDPYDADEPDEPADGSSPGDPALARDAARPARGTGDVVNLVTRGAARAATRLRGTA